MLPSRLLRLADNCVVLLLRFSRFFGFRPFFRFNPDPTLSGESYDRSSAKLLKLVFPMSARDVEAERGERELELELVNVFSGAGSIETNLCDRV